MWRLGELGSALVRRVAYRGRRLAGREAYALWADSYPPWAHNPLMQAEQQVMAPLIASTSPNRALDVGTGSGRYLPLLAATGARSVVGVDFSLPMLTRASGSGRGSVRPQDLADPSSRLAESRRVSADVGGCAPAQTARIGRVCADARCLPFVDATFDVVSSSLMVGDVSDLAGWIREMERVLAPGGHLIYSDFHPRWVSAGWRRTFHAADGRRIEIAHFPHTVTEHLMRLEEVRLDVRLIREQGLAEHAAGGTGPDTPIVIVFHAVKKRSPRSSSEQPSICDGRR